VPRAKNVRTNTDEPQISLKTVHRWDKTETHSSKSKAPAEEPGLKLQSAEQPPISEFQLLQIIGTISKFVAVRFEERGAEHFEF
jgi:hypothetical protein